MKPKKITAIQKCSHQGCENVASFTKNEWEIGGFYNLRWEDDVYCSVGCLNNEDEYNKHLKRKAV